MKTLYLHGLPGGQAELGLTRLPHLTTPDRNQPSFAQLANSLPSGELHLFGFSLGAAAALRLAALLPDRVVRVTLASPAAPLGLGDFLPDAAGAPVFRAARSHAQLAALTTVQSTLARFTPGFLIRRMLATARGRERVFFGDRQNRAVLTAAVQQGLTQNREAYLTELAAYVQPWEKHLAQVRCQVSIFHGTDDTWAPPAMATALARALKLAEVTWCDGLGHYTTLVQATEALARHPDLR